MKKSEVISKTRFYTKASTDDYSDAEILADYNQLRREYLLFVLRSQGYSNIGYHTFTGDLVDYSTASEGENGYEGEYSLDFSIINVDRIELKETSTSDYVKAEIYHESDNDYSEFQDLDSTFDWSEPKVRIMRKSLIIRPLPENDVTGGIKIIASSNNGSYYDAVNDKISYGDLSNDNDYDLILDVNLHRIYPLKLAKEYALREKDSFNPLWSQELVDLEESLDDLYAKQVSRPLVMRFVNHNFK